MTVRFSSCSLPNRAVEARLRLALEQGKSVHLSVQAGHFVPSEVRLRAWMLVREKYLPVERVTIESSIGSSELLETDSEFCRRCDAFVSWRSCPHGEESWFRFEDERLVECLLSGGNLPRELFRPEVAEVLREHLTSAKTPLASRIERPSGDEQKGFVLWFTGLSGAGKSTLSRAVADMLVDELSLEVLDGDEVRTYLSKGLGFSKEDRDTNVRRIGYVARLLARNGISVITAAISPYRDARDEVRSLASRDGIPFVEVYASASVEALAARDVKGLYRRAIDGEIPHFTGVSDPYEPPITPEVVVRTDRDPVSMSVDQILAYLRGRGLIGKVK